MSGPIRRVGGGTFSLEAFKFGLYVALPVLATAAYNTPGVMEQMIQFTKVTGRSERWATTPSVGPMPTDEEVREIRRQAEIELEKEEELLRMLNMNGKESMTVKQVNDIKEKKGRPWWKLFSAQKS
mmetsp:Transcript_16457/g.36968  ORF Transcript_16457/g.36968 Transcript_16457/m.36968 type:complete len:126 (-) Transcript_16457:50-427(-)|eukprot:CAMPEP_0113320872 /NCGR_PEP_ID=MMETSP0010_2-20120614/14544_1 /TAXON_ID=216773 ORGANISM="Corethron hystrix, Strain 308" /NCGR_SAMPLE_ID=MMETSP0010_2 /ASSEMBLY_ACC=CAM_ASM_000155 /LENGTH=125 /DNA_ID=CAMNT_0000178815 /DNA_START=155 /DNA_END=532 /DNA_ORIENTATION=- /assembly_acc=CAM_ASM_000155